MYLAGLLCGMGILAVYAVAHVADTQFQKRKRR